MPIKVVMFEVDSILSPEQKRERVERIRSRCNSNERGCWLYPGATAETGYCIVKVKFRSWAAHRFMWAATRGPIPEGKLVLHTCDNKSCVNPDHLFIGTHLDNMQDKCRKGRHRNGFTGPIDSGWPLGQP